MARRAWLVKGREDATWPLLAFTTYEEARKASVAMHGDLGDEAAFVRPVNLYRTYDSEEVQHDQI